MNTKFLLDKRDRFFFGHLSVLGDGTSRQRLIKHFHIWMLRQVVKATQVTNETLQLLEELKDKRKHEKKNCCYTNQPTHQIIGDGTRGVDSPACCLFSHLLSALTPLPDWGHQSQQTISGALTDTIPATQASVRAENSSTWWVVGELVTRCLQCDPDPKL